MPSVSVSQHNFMAKAATDKGFAAKHKIDQSTAKDFLKADKGKSPPMSDSARKKGRYKNG